MREHRGYRVYDIEAGKYVTDELYWLVDSDGNLCALNDGELIGFPSCVKEDETGLKDKNGVRVFEKDILRVKTYWTKGKGYKELVYFSNGYMGSEKGETFWTVEWLNHHTESNGWYVYGIDRRWHKPLTFSRIYNAEAEVVGNIHDNPELMEEKK